MSDKLFIPKIEVRSSVKDKKKKYVIKGYATNSNNIYAFKKEIDGDGTPVRSFKEYFTDKGIENIYNKSKSENIFIDYGHQTAGIINVRSVMKRIQDKSGMDLNDEIAYIENAINTSDIPLFKLEDIKIDDKGLFVEISANPFYRDVDDEHQKYFDAVWSSLETGYINGMSLNFKPTDFVEINNELTQINDADVYGISLLSGAANNMASITEVAMRCVEKVRGNKKWKKQRMTSLML